MAEFIGNIFKGAGLTPLHMMYFLLIFFIWSILFTYKKFKLAKKENKETVPHIFYGCLFLLLLLVTTFGIVHTHFNPHQNVW